MTVYIKELFNVIKNQLLDKEHPLNVISKYFVKSYISYYSALTNIPHNSGAMKQ